MFHRWWLVFAFVLCLPVLTYSQNALDIPDDGQINGLMPVTIPVLLDNDCPVQGFVLAIAYDTSAISMTDFNAGPAATSVGAELVVAEIFDPMGGATLAVVLDFTDPFDSGVLGADAVILTPYIVNASTCTP